MMPMKLMRLKLMPTKTQTKELAPATQIAPSQVEEGEGALQNEPVSEQVRRISPPNLQCSANTVSDAAAVKAVQRTQQPMICSARQRESIQYEGKLNTPLTMAPEVLTERAPWTERWSMPSTLAAVAVRRGRPASRWASEAGLREWASVAQGVH